jgi:hypothetical protein
MDSHPARTLKAAFFKALGGVQPKKFNCQKFSKTTFCKERVDMEDGGC